jgi:hypothetical protein
MPIIPETEMAGPAAPAPGLPRTRGSTDDFNVYDDARTYYTAEERHRNNRAGPRTRTYSQVASQLVLRSARMRTVADDMCATEQLAEADGAVGHPRAVQAGQPW